MKRTAFVIAAVSVCTGVFGQPVAERAALRFLQRPTAKANAVLLVQFSAGTPASRIIRLGEGHGSTTLHDDGVAPDARAGDGIHSASILIDVKQIEERQKRLMTAKASPLFVGRELVGSATAYLSAQAVAWNEIPLIPNRWNFVRPKKGKVALALPLSPPVPGALVPVYPILGLSFSDPGKSLLITDTAVVRDRRRTNDPCSLVTGVGPWTFGHLMAEMADGAGIDRSDFLNNWLEKWLTAQTVNTFNVAARPAAMNRTINRWPQVSGKPSLFAAPFRLVAIVNRIDLGGNLAYGAGDAGEARFIFALVDTTNACTPEPFLVIFEYKVNITGCRKVKKWAQQWKDLEKFLLFGESYNAALQAITDQFTEEGTTPTQIPNKSSLSQLRTNAFMPEPEPSKLTPWELREFRLVPVPVVPPFVGGYLFEDTVKQTPDLSFGRSTLLADYENANAGAILTDSHVVPRTLPMGQPFLAGSALLRGDQVTGNEKPLFYWDGPPPPAGPLPSATLSGTTDLRHHFSLNTCNGCHGQETSAIFTHVSENGVLSEFLTGVTVPDPANEVDSSGARRERDFNDLERRGVRMAEILAEPCLGNYLLSDLFYDRIRFSH